MSAALLLAACAPEDAAITGLAPGGYSGEGRDRLCIAGEGAAQRAGFITYGASDSNCTATGRVESSDGKLALVPAGEGECRVELSVAGGRITLGRSGPACAYYCGPGATFDGRSFGPTPGVAVTDFAGAALC